MTLDIFELTAAQIIYNPDASTAINQGIHEMGADKRCPAGNQNLSSFPKTI